MFAKKTALLFLGTLLALGAGGCATETEMVQAAAVDGPHTPMFRMVVFGANMDEAKRRILEDRLARDLRARGVDARPSYELFPVMPSDHGVARAATAAAGYEGVLRVTLTNIDTTQIYEPGHSYRLRLYSLESSLWTPQNQLLWNANTQTLNPTSYEDLVGSVSSVLLPELTKQSFLLPTRPEKTATLASNRPKQ